MSDTIVQDITARLVDALHPSKVIWFGSRARGGGDPESDYDFLVVANTTLRLADRLYQARWATRDIRAAMDIIVLTPEEFDRYSRWKSSVVYSAAMTGRVVFEAQE